MRDDLIIPATLAAVIAVCAVIGIFCAVIGIFEPGKADQHQVLEAHSERHSLPSAR